MSEKISAWRSPWVMGWIALLVVVLMVNGLMIFLAFDNSPGLVVEDYYERGQSYSRHVLKRQARFPGWQMKIDPPADIEQDRPAVFRFVVVDKAGVPVTPDRVVLFAYRPSDAEQDFSIPMAQETPGHYVAEARFPLKGLWDILVSVQTGEDEYNTPRRIHVAAND